MAKAFPPPAKPETRTPCPQPNPRSRYLVGSAPAIADVALYSYTALAPEGGIQLDAYPNVLAWLSRMESQPGFLPVQCSALPKAG